MKNKKSGFTLIEIIIVIAIISILLSISLTGVVVYKNLIEESNKQTYLIKIKESFIYYKEYALKNQTNLTFKIKKDGSIEFLNSNNKIIEKIDKIKELTLEHNSGTNETNLYRYDIDYSGKIIQSGRISFSDKNNVNHRITISTGDEIIRIYSPYNPSKTEEFK